MNCAIAVILTLIACSGLIYVTIRFLIRKIGP